MHLTWFDWLIVVGSLVLCFAPALFFGRRAGKNTAEFFVSGRSVPWWLAGLSMVATTFASDTPLLVTDIVRRQGVAGNWAWWAFVLTGMATVFFYAQLWRRSGVMTDLEFYELRYSGEAARAVRGFRAIYLGLFFNCLIMANVNLAACKIANILFGLDRWQTLGLVGLLNVVFAAHSGLWGVLVIDMIQFVLKMTAVIAAAYFAVRLPQVGGLHGLIEKVSHLKGPNGINYLNFFPDFSNHLDIAIAVFIMPIAVQWWAVWYPGAEPGGGSFIAQRMLASKSERDSVGAVLFFNVAHFILRPWPWILVALASLIVFPNLDSIQAAFPHLDHNLVREDIAYPAMLKFLPVGFAGLMVGGLVAANSSTILTLLNWGASYLVHDFYQRFVYRGADEKHYVFAGRIATVLLFIISSGFTFLIESAKDSFDIIIQVGAGTGLLYLVRWFWWRITAWCEIVAMISSFVISVAFIVLHRTGIAQVPSQYQLLITVAITTFCWLATAFLGPGTDWAVLTDFYRKVYPPGPGWGPVRDKAGVPADVLRETTVQVPIAMLGWALGCVLIWSGLFVVGTLCYEDYAAAGLLTVVFALSAYGVVKVIERLWRPASEPSFEP